MRLFLNFFSVMFICFICGACNIYAQERLENENERESTTNASAVKMDDSENPILKKYSWIKDKVDSKDCKGERVEVYSASEGPSKFIIIEQDGQRVMYDESGTVYCTNSSQIKCDEYYKLSKSDSWICNK